MIAVRHWAIALGLGAAALAVSPAAAEPETREEYLERLRDICAVECRQPRPFIRAARKIRRSEDTELALIMDVAFVRRAGDRYELFNVDMEDDPLVTLALLESAGINTSGSNGVGGLPRGRNGVLSPDVIVVSLDEQVLFDLYEASQPVSENAGEGKGSREGSRTARRDEDGILVEGDSNRTIDKPTMQALRSTLFKRRIVVRGKPRLTPVFVGGRIDHKNKQVTLMLESADDLVILPRFDENGEAVIDGEFVDRQARVEAP
jgi:hypothetical protein